jgi:predicted acyltransferase
MFWIVGAEALVEGLRKISDNGLIRGVADQLEHAEWAGFHFEDLIFPLFLFIVGVSSVFSLERIIEKEGRASACKRIFRRSLVMYLLGLFYYGGFSKHFTDIRLLGVLQRIALCYLFSGLAFCFLKTRGRILLCAGILLGYWGLMALVPVPGVGAGSFEEGRNLANYIDAQYLPLFKWNGDHDPEGLLSTLPAVATCLLGLFAGSLFKRADLTASARVRHLILWGLAGVALGWLWHLQFPVIKKLWTSSFVLVAGGYSCLLLAAFYQIVDVWRFQRWAQPFIWIGMNPITIYLAVHIFGVRPLAQRFVGGDLNRCFGSFGELVIALVSLALVFGLSRFLYQRKIFLRI